MSVIDKPFGRQAFEVIHDRLGGILAEELDTQAVLTYDPDLLGMTVFKERDIPYSEGETPAMNVTFMRGEFDMQTLIQHDGQFRYAIEVTIEAKGKDNALGDRRAMNRCQKIMGSVMAILRSPKYVRLGFGTSPAFIKNRHVESVEFGKPIRQDSSHTVMGRVVLVVSAVDYAEFVDPVPAAGTRARVYLWDTPQGYVWSRNFGQVFDSYFDESFE